MNGRERLVVAARKLGPEAFCKDIEKEAKTNLHYYFNSKYDLLKNARLKTNILPRKGGRKRLINVVKKLGPKTTVKVLERKSHTSLYAHFKNKNELLKEAGFDIKDRKQELVKAAKKLGFEASLRRIARETGFANETSLYDYFKNKRELFLAAGFSKEEINEKLGLARKIACIHNNVFQPPTNYERQIMTRLEEMKASYKLHPVIYWGCFDFRIKDFVIEAEAKRSVGQSYYRSLVLNEKAKRVKENYPKLKFVAIIPPTMHPEVAKKLSEEYYLVIFPEDGYLLKYIEILKSIKDGKCLFLDLLNEVRVPRPTLIDRVNKLIGYEVIQKQIIKNKISLRVTSKGEQILNDFGNIKISSFDKFVLNTLNKNQNEHVVKFLSLRQWFSVNPSGHITHRKYLNKSEKHIRDLLDKNRINHQTQKEIKFNLYGYEITRLVDEFIPPNIIIEIISIRLKNKKNIISSINRLIGRVTLIKDFYPNYKVIGIIVGENKKLNKLYPNIKDILFKSLDGIVTYTNDNPDELINLCQSVKKN